MSPSGKESFARRAVTVGFIATLFLFQAIPVASLLLQGRDIELPLALGTTNFLVVPPLLFAVDRLLARRSSSILSRAMVGAFVAAIAGGALGALLWSGTIPHVGRQESDLNPLTKTLFGSFAMGVVLSMLVVGAWSLASVFPRVLAQEKVRALQLANLELEAAQLRAHGELARLRGQLEPHFLLNTLTFCGTPWNLMENASRSTRSFNGSNATARSSPRGTARRSRSSGTSIQTPARPVSRAFSCSRSWKTRSSTARCARKGKA